MDKKTDYALRAAVYLAGKYESGETVNTSEISKACDTPAKYLAQILLLLKKDALITSITGRHGGYRLMRNPEMISVAEILQSVSADYYEEDFRSGARVPGRYESGVILIDSKIKSAVRSAMSGISLADVIELTGE